MADIQLQEVDPVAMCAYEQSLVMVALCNRADHYIFAL